MISLININHAFNYKKSSHLFFPKTHKIRHPRERREPATIVIPLSFLLSSNLKNSKLELLKLQNSFTKLVLHLILYQSNEQNFIFLIKPCLVPHTSLILEGFEVGFGALEEKEASLVDLKAKELIGYSK